MLNILYIYLKNRYMLNIYYFVIMFLNLFFEFFVFSIFLFDMQFSFIYAYIIIQKYIFDKMNKSVFIIYMILNNILFLIRIADSEKDGVLFFPLQK